MPTGHTAPIRRLHSRRPCRRKLIAPIDREFGAEIYAAITSLPWRCVQCAARRCRVGVRFVPVPTAPPGVWLPGRNAVANREFRRVRSWQRDYGACVLLCIVVARTDRRRRSRCTHVREFSGRQGVKREATLRSERKGWCLQFRWAWSLRNLARNNESKERK